MQGILQDVETQGILQDAEMQGILQDAETQRRGGYKQGN